MVDDVFGVVLDVEVTTGETNEGEQLLARLDAVARTTAGAVPYRIHTVLTDNGTHFTEPRGMLVSVIGVSIGRG